MECPFCSGHLNLFRNLLQGDVLTFVHVCSIGGAPGVGAFNGLATNVTTLQTDFPTIGLNGTAVNVRTSAAAHVSAHVSLAFPCWKTEVMCNFRITSHSSSGSLYHLCRCCRAVLHVCWPHTQRLLFLSCIAMPARQCNAALCHRTGEYTATGCCL